MKEKSYHQPPFVIPDKEKVWNRIQMHIHQSIKQIPLYSRVHMIRVATVAALFAFLAGTAITWGILHYQALPPESQALVVSTPPGQKTTLTLPDGTQVWLNSESHIHYPSDFNAGRRIVQLEGEAFFEVTKSAGMPFIVETKAVNVKVHGTSFNVKAYKEDINTTVALKEGKVSLLSAVTNNFIAALKPNEIAIIDKYNSYEILPCDAESESIWRHNKLHFENLPAQEVWKKLERWYGVYINVENEKPEQTYRFTIKTETLTELLVLINKLTPIDYRLNGEEVNIRYKQ
ncbi:MAG: FecR family protein [Tannerellaceae bacterium]|jgi:ferric-dicitrate binding protein FerR (iron transport regulator)|nr:FecR family protein [Tannerellaceae bacterium]